jgi:hypothetical protein
MRRIRCSVPVSLDAYIAGSTIISPSTAASPTAVAVAAPMQIVSGAQAQMSPSNSVSG